MKAVMMLENRNGIRFNNHRLSRDTAVTNHLKELTQDQTLWIESESQDLYGSIGCLLTTKDKNPAVDEFILFEKEPNQRWWKRITDLYVYRWNRDYPSDEKVQIPSTFKLMDTEEFEGTSHEKITLEHFRRS